MSPSEMLAGREKTDFIGLEGEQLPQYPTRRELHDEALLEGIVIERTRQDALDKKDFETGESFGKQGERRLWMETLEKLIMEFDAKREVAQSSSAKDKWFKFSQALKILKEKVLNELDKPTV